MTLVEVLVTALILVFAISTLMMSFVYCKRIVLNDTHRFNSSLILNEHLEEIASLEEPTAVQNYINEWNGKVITKKISSDKTEPYTLTLRFVNVVTPTSTSTISWITATVSWESFFGSKNLSMSVFTNEPG